MIFLIIAMLVILCIIIFIMYRVFYKGKFYKKGFFTGFGVLNDYYPASCLTPFFYTETLQEVLNMALHSEKLVSIRQGFKYEMGFTKMKYKEERKLKERIIEFIEFGYDNNLLDEK